MAEPRIVDPHDPVMIDATKAYARDRNYPNDRFEFQMLYGMGDPLKKALVAAGYRVRAYVPYGPLTEGLAYLVRRVDDP